MHSGPSPSDSMPLTALKLLAQIQSNYKDTSLTKNIRTIFKRTYSSLLNHMHCDLCPHLTLRIMGLGFSLHEAERIARFLMTGIVVVVTIMGYTLRNSGEEDSSDERTRIPSDTPGIHPGIMGSQCSGFGKSAVDARRDSPAFFQIHCQAPA
jgi:hypothetical protein